MQSKTRDNDLFWRLHLGMLPQALEVVSMDIPLEDYTMEHRELARALEK
ncbi:hypothetical protein [Thermofilum sp.]